MGRPEQPVDPEDGPVARLAWELRQLRETAGRPSYRRLAQRAGFAPSTLAAAAKGARLSSFEVVVAYAVACGGDQAEWEERWRAASAAIKDAESALQAAHPRCPYPGLAPLEADDSDLFFGRSAVVEQLQAEVARAALVAVFGASGSGKSSLLRAGLIPALDEAEIPTALLTPGSHPLRELDEARARLADSDGVLVIDQFEETFTLCRDEAERTAFLDAVADLPALVLGVRADFYGHCAQHAGLARALRAGAQLPLGPMSKVELRSSIAGPAARTGLTVDPELVEELLDDATGEPGALPLMAHALRETWQHSDRATLRLADYQATGGMLGAVAQTAERVYTDLDPADQDLVRALFLRLARLGDGTEDTRRRIDRDELTGVAAADDIDRILKRLAAARLIVVDAATVEVSHEALIRAWPRLREWLSDDRDAIRDHRRLTEAALEWDADERDDGYLFRGARLASWEGREPAGLSDAEQAFLSASRAGDLRERTAARRRVRMTVGGLAAGLVVMSVLAVVALVNASDADEARDLAFSRLLSDNARDEMPRDPELALLLARRAYQAAPITEAATVLRNALESSRVRATVRVGQGKVLGVAISPDGRRMATTGADGTTKVWGRKGWGLSDRPVNVLRSSQGGGLSPVFSPDGRYLASSGGRLTVNVWDLNRGAEPTVLSGSAAAVERLAFSPDGRYLAAGAQDGSLRVLDRQGGAPRGIRGKAKLPGVPAFAFSPDGRRLAISGGDGKIAIADLRTNRVVARLKNRSPVRSVSLTFSPDGRRLSHTDIGGGVGIWTLTGKKPKVKPYIGGTPATKVATFDPAGHRKASAGDSGVIEVWAEGELVSSMKLPGHRGDVLDLAFSSDGRTLASAGADGTVRIWNTGFQANSTVFPGHKGASGKLRFSRDGSRFASNGEDGAVRVWDARRGGAPLVFPGASGPRNDVALSPDGRRLASESADGKVRVRAVTPGAEARTLRVTPSINRTLSFSPDGRRLAIGTGRATVEIWPVEGGTPTYIETGQDSVTDVEFAPDGRLATAGRDGTVRLWTGPSDDGRLIAHSHEKGIGAITFTRDGRKLATYGMATDTTIRIWDVRDGGDPVVLRWSRGAIYAAMAFSPDGNWLVKDDSENMVAVRDPADRDGEAIRLTGHSAEVTFVTFSPDGRLATSHRDGSIRLWPCSVCRPIGDLMKLAGQRATRDLTPAEQRRFLGPDRS